MQMIDDQIISDNKDNLDKKNVTVEDGIVRWHWATFGRHYYTQYDYEKKTISNLSYSNHHHHHHHHHNADELSLTSFHQQQAVSVSSSSSCFPGEIVSSWVSVDRSENNKKPRSNRLKRRIDTDETQSDDQVNNKKGIIELSETSCVESCSTTSVFFDKEVLLIEANKSVSLSEVSCIQQTDNNNNTSITIFSDEAPLQSNVESTVDQKPKDLIEYNLVCSENFSSYSEEEFSTNSEFESELFPKSSSCYDYFSDYTPSMLIDSYESSSQSDWETNLTPPVYFPLFAQYSKQFSKLNASSSSIPLSEQIPDEFTLLKFENEEYEESYRKFRSRERKLVLNDYVEQYFSTTEFGKLVLQQRIKMVNWIVEESNVRELQSETMFLGVSLLDRFLDRGFFKQKRKLQLLGIACLSLATRLEENQPYNCVRQSTFNVGKNTYSKSEVVGMEWLVQEVLNFQCFLPTIYNFLWFYLKAARANGEVDKTAKYLAVLSLLDHERLCYWPSTVAAGLVILASLSANQESSCQWVMETHVRTKNDDLPECIQSLEWLVKYVC
ncbi:hypothetical protein IFM89_020820 [Coptis chinensis]|uniref:Cyclin-like domain-containing protein n=1 Tax=Coptis chinensis TaxID=261450 RepID=A0A835IWX7_9MAGN|nr:hypothetical protein IFM89_020820 [Coptis chinensis]